MNINKKGALKEAPFLLLNIKSLIRNLKELSHD